MNNGSSGLTTESPVLELAGVSKAFGALKVIDNVNLTVGRKERHALIGPNGAGKSTLFNLVSGRIAPSAGEIYSKGRKITGLAPHRINRLSISRSFQITHLFPKLSVFDNICVALMGRHGVRFGLFRSLSGMEAVNSEALQFIEDFNLAHRRDERAMNLTYSEQRALEIALTIATDPDLILLDEPTAGMSRDETDYMIDLIRRTTVGRSLLIVEHDLDVVFRLCDRISVLVYGSILATGRPDEIRANADVQHAYLGESVG